LKTSFNIIILLLEALTISFSLNAQDTIIYPNGVKEIVMTNANGIKHGPTRHFDKEGHLLRTGQYENGEAIGEWKLYYPNGQVEKIWNYEYYSFHNSRETGQITSYFKNGQVQETYYLRNGKMHGAYKYYHQNGQLYWIRFYKDGENIGKWRDYYESGQLHNIEKYSKKGEARGKWKWYYENGKRKSTGRWRNNFQVGKWKYFDQHGRLKRTECQLTGKVQCYDRRRHKITCRQSVLDN
jgi:antitoxin component YwqK of YwqJK toxin-antitoxin module